MSGRLILLGTGGHAKVVLEALRLAAPGAEILPVDDDPSLAGASFMGLAILGGRDRLPTVWAAGDRIVPAIGNNHTRLALVVWARTHGFAFASVIHPSAILGASVTLDEGCFIAPGAIVNAATRIGRCAIINTGASVDHDCEIGDGVHIAPGARLCGDVVVGTGALIGAGAIVVPGRRIGRHAVVGAGTVVTRDVAEGTCVAGNPARTFKENKA